MKELDFAGHKDWRLPTADEMNDLFMAVKADPDNDCSWFKKMGFGYMTCAAYWSGDPEIVNGKKTGKIQIFDFRYKTKGAQEKNYTMFFWPVRSIK